MSGISRLRDWRHSLGSDTARSSRGPGRAWRRLEAHALLLMLIAIVVFFSFYPDTTETYPTLGNFQAIVGNTAVLAIVALAALIPLVTNEFDLSVGATAGVSSVFAASALSGGTAIPLAILLGIAIGLLVGTINALIVTRLGVNAVIATLGMATILAGVVTMKTGGVAVVSNIPELVTDFGSRNTFGIPRTAFALAIVAAIVYYLLEHTPFGRYLYALGSNPEAARLAGLPTRRTLGMTFVVAGMLAGAAGVLQVARAGGADPRVGESFTLPALAAAFLSAAAVKPGHYNVGGVLVALFFLAALNSGLNLAGAETYVTSYVNGAALIVGVSLAAYLGRRRKVF